MNLDTRQYGGYTKVQCCTDCDYAHNTHEKMVLEFPICPNCGGGMKLTLGRWIFTKHKTSADWFLRYGYPHINIIYHGFVRGRQPVENDCNCAGCKISDSGNGYQPCHNREELSEPPQET